jgi:hypothetical protein
MNTFGLTVIVGLSLGNSSPPGGEVPSFGHARQPELVEGAYTFECPGVRATVRYRQERREPDPVPTLEYLRVTLLDLTVSGASLPPDQLATAREVFRSFAWVRVSASCYGGRMLIGVNGMPHRLFFDSILGDACLPAHRSSTIGLSASGVTHVVRFDPRDEARRCQSPRP